MPVGKANAGAVYGVPGPQRGEGSVELGAACAAAAARIRAALTAPGKIGTKRPAGITVRANSGHFCVSVVTDKSVSRVGGIVKEVLKQTAAVKKGECEKFARCMGVSPKAGEACVAALQRGVAGAMVVVAGPVKEAKKAAVIAAIEKGAKGVAAAAGKAAGAEAGESGAAVAGISQLRAKGVALAVLSDLLAENLRAPAAICGDAVEVCDGSLKSAKKLAGKKSALAKKLGKDGEAARAYWRACQLAIAVPASPPAAGAIVDGVMAALK